MADSFVKSQGSQSVPLEYTHEEDALRIFGFWIFLATDLLLFASLFATYSVLYRHVGHGPGPLQIFDITGFSAETFILLTSSFTCGLATYSMHRGQKAAMMAWMIVTILLGVSFISLELSEFASDIARGATLQTSAFLSAFFTLVGTHGAHVSFGIVWMTLILIQLAIHGLTPTTARKAFIVSLYWHFLDVVWIFIFTIVYLLGVMS
ncbi:cytochrome o ubiquinol oxidase subunit III [Sulfoacidibacillus thermotolerans]|uniref:Cytochrome o ubiquinol oxidase subunit III n=2 Tax=Sulfoacidibacillus thermotolerans TaxID=1765684 RepID=A0A2U3D8H8_SULT2|nr:cytochrome (ubi)quinol oxidase subunit III [Sulfoacidibacillus thermotolerans]PWI57594.1 cytochrome o ubiquinol oxidase subunit III [Sulfoacidibacillus thermotolerans]